MRIWSLSPALLDRQGLIACWREALLAQKVLRGLTRGYTRHPQLERFRTAENPLTAVAFYLHGLAEEADSRGYRFDRSRIMMTTQQLKAVSALPVTEGQLAYELRLLTTKVQERSPERLGTLQNCAVPAAHPLFHVEAGDIESWERPKPELTTGPLPS